ncbi:MMPL family transporter [Clostridium bovifaecis]|uniref:MMPL family transporter n=1 Tax=Clostridium bovifaecis TaxID=2184719 RepID=A0A6I6EU60_9CLOT|nr:MMPL family transporter [Clostridium bovifaecis]
MNIAKFAVKRPVTIFMGVIAILLIGVVSLRDLSIDLLPNMNIPVAVVSTSYSNVGPEEVEKLITKPLEQAISTTPNIKEVTSRTVEGNSIVIAQFNDNTDMDFAALDMREKVDMVKGFLPDGAGEPMVLKIDPNAQSIMSISVTGKKDLQQLQSFVEDNIQPQFEKIEGVASADISGGLEKQVQIAVNQESLQGFGLSIDYIAQILAAENLNSPGGSVNKGNKELLVRTMGEFTSVEDIENIPIPLKTGGVVRLRDIATVGINNKDIESVAMINGENGLSISIQKQSDANTVSVSKRVNKELEKLKAKYPDVKVDVLIDQADYINSSISNVSSSAVIGGILAVLVLFLFLGNIKSTLVIGTAIPISIISTFILLYFAKITLNLMTLGGLALGVGMLVDNSVVVLENIYRYIQDGHDRKEAAIQGTNEVGVSVIASTLTTVVVFLPIALTSGITGEVFRDFALTIVFSLATSLVVSLTFTPMLASKILHEEEIINEEEKLLHRKGIFWLSGIFNRLFRRVERRYKGILTWAISNRKKTVVLGIIISLLSTATLATVGAEFFPTADQGQISISVELPEGASIEEVTEMAAVIQKKAEGIQEIDTIFTQIGSSGTSGFMGGGTNTANITVQLKPLKERTRSDKDIADQLREETRDMAGAEISYATASMSMSGMGSSPISVEIKGDDLTTLKNLGEQFKAEIAKVDGTREVETSMGEGKPEIRIKLNRTIASQYGLTAAQISSQVSSTIKGKTATTFKLDNDEIDVVVKGDELYKESVNNLQNIMITSGTGSNIPLNLVADVEIERGPTSISRSEQSRLVTVTSQIYGRDLNSVVKDIDAKLSKIKLPEGYSYDMGGENEEMVEAFTELAGALLIAIALVYMILASQFESLLNPFIIMFSVPLAVAGGALGLAITRRNLSVIAFIGVIMLAGIVVNNAIVLIDYISIRRSRGEDRTEAILNSGPRRLRPILMTTLTTILGLIPMALGIGEGAEMQAPLATVVIGGLLYSTVLTLVYIPVVYSIFDDLKVKSKSRKNKNKVISQSM